MSAFTDALARLRLYNLNPFNAVANAFGLTGVGGPDTNFEPMLADVVTASQEVATLAADAFSVGGTARLTWDPDTSDANPGAGKLRGNSAPLSAVTALYVSTTDFDGVDIAAALATWDDSTSTVKGTLRLAVVGDRAKRADFRVSGAITTHTGYVTVPVTFVSASAAIAAGAELVLGFVANGDAGPAGGVNTFAGRSGAVAPQAGDYTASQVSAIGQGRHTIAVPAVAMISRTTNGPSAGTVETATNKVMLKTWDFDAATNEFVQFAVRMPKSWDEGTITAVFAWSHASTTTNFGTVWGLQALALSDGDAMDAAFGTGQTVTDTGGTANVLYVSPETSAITIAGSPQAEDLVVFQVYRAATSGSDTMATDARLHSVTLYYSVNATTDA